MGEEKSTLSGPVVRYFRSRRRRRCFSPLIFIFLIFIALFFFYFLLSREVENLFGGSFGVFYRRRFSPLTFEDFTNKDVYRSHADLLSEPIQSAKWNISFCHSTVISNLDENSEKRCLPSYENALFQFPWNRQLQATYLAQWWTYNSRIIWRKLLSIIFPFNWNLHVAHRKEIPTIFSTFLPYVEIEPPVPIELSQCDYQPSALPSSEEDWASFCADGQKLHKGSLTGRVRFSAAKIADVFIFGTDLDVLEIRLYELNATVDLFVLVESSYTTLGLNKPLFFERNKERFQPFLPKILHIPLGETEERGVATQCINKLKGGKDNCWGPSIQSLQRSAATRSFLRHVQMSKTFSDTDLVMIGDVDEVPSGERIRFVKYCEATEDPQNPHDPIPWLLTGHPGRMDKFLSFKGDSYHGPPEAPHAFGPVSDMYTVSNLQYWVDRGQTWRYRQRSKAIPSRYFYGGWHLTDSTYLPFLQLKMHRDDMKPGYEPVSFYEAGMRGDIATAQATVWSMTRTHEYTQRVWKPEEVPRMYWDNLLFGTVPWIMRCFPDRYPSWFGRIDLRYFMSPYNGFFVDGKPVDVHSLAEWKEKVENLRSHSSLFSDY